MLFRSEVKWALESITINKASGGNGIPVELFQILKDDAVKVLHSICQQIWKTQPRCWERLKAGGEGDEDEMVGWHHQHDGHESE